MQKIFESSNNNSTKNIKSKIKLQIEKKFQKSESNLTYKFPLKKENIIMNYNDDSLNSLKELTIYDLREQNNKNRRNLTKDGFFNDSFEKSKEKIDKYIKGKYQILKGKSLLHGEEIKDSSNFFDFSYQGQQNKPNKHGKNQSGSSDLKSFFKRSMMFQTNPLYKLAQDNLTMKRKIYKGLSGNFVGMSKKNEVISLKNALSNTFLEINSKKVSLPIKKTSNSFKITTKK